MRSPCSFFWMQCLSFACLGLVLLPASHSRADGIDEQWHRLAPSAISSLAFAFDGERFLAADKKVARLWDLETGKELRRFEGHAEVIRAVAFSPDGKQVLTGSGRQTDMSSRSTDNSTRLWDVATGKEIRRFEGHTSYVHTTQFSPDGKRVLTAGRDSTARVWDIATGEQLFVFSGLSCLYGAAAFSLDGSCVLGFHGGRGVGTRLWDSKTGREVFRIQGSQWHRSSAELSPNGQLVVTASYDGTARTWDSRTGRQVRVFTGHTKYVHHAAFTADGERIVTGSSDGTVRIWHASTGNEIRRFTNPGQVWRVVLNSDGKRFFTKWHAVDMEDPWRRGVSLWDSESCRELVRLPRGGLKVVAGFTPEGDRFVVVDRGRQITLWSAETGKIISP